MFCSKCGQQVEGNSAFCGNCGTAVNSVERPVVQQQSRPVQRAKLHCPTCKSYNISITTESSVNGAITTARGNMAATSVSNTHRNFWICADCGAKFRNIQSLEEEIASTKKSRTISTVFTFICLAVFIWLLVLLMESPLLVFIIGSGALFSFVATVVFFCFIFVYGGRVKKMTAERDFLLKNCFD